MLIKERLCVYEAGEAGEEAGDTRSGRPALLIRRNKNKEMVGRRREDGEESGFDDRLLIERSSLHAPDDP